MVTLQATGPKSGPIYEGGPESSVIGVITLLIYMIGCCIIP